MATVRAVAVRWVDDAFPGFVEVVLTDAEGQQHRLTEKPPVLGASHLAADSDYPTTVRVPCQVLGASADGTVEVALRHGIEFGDGTACFRVDAASVEGG